MTTIGDAADAYAADFNAYKAARDELAGRLRTLCASLGVQAAVDGRVKSPTSFIKKMVVKDRDGDPEPWVKIDDRVGLRIVTSSQPDLRRVRAVLESTYDDLEFFGQEDKTADLAPRVLGYRGFHAQVLVPGHYTADGAPIEAEVQLRTQAEDLWNSTEHKLNYKAVLKPGPESERRLMRLSVLTEIFDQEVELVMKAIQSDPAYADTRLLRTAEQEYHLFVGEPGDDRLSLAVIGQLRPALGDTEGENYALELRAFATDHGDQLRDLFKDYGPSSAMGGADVGYWLVSQPESLIVLYLLDSKPMALARAVRHTELETVVERLSNAWGKALPEVG